MKYPVYVHLGDEKTAHGVIIPDFEGCYSASDDIEDLEKNINEATQVYFDGEDMPIPPPSDIRHLITHADYQDGGIWMLVDIDTSKLSTKSKRVNITFPENLLAQLDERASLLGMTRSSFLQKAVVEQMK